MIPPWGDRLNDPLVNYEVRQRRRTGGTPMGFITITVLIIIGLIIYLVLVNAFTNSFTSTHQQLEETYFIVMLGLISMSVLGHWRLLLATLGRSTAMITQKRESGDWELIYITPVSKSRWFHAQFTALGWQIFPLIRRLMIVQFLMGVLAFPALIIMQQSQYSYSYSYAVSPIRLGTELLFFLAMVVVEPIFTAGVFASAALVESSMRRRTWVSFVNGFSMVYAVRVVIALVMQVSGFIFLVVILAISSGSDIGEIPSEGFLYLCVYCCVGALAYAFFLEWIPAAGAVLLAAADREGNLYLLAWLVLTLAVSHIITPPILMRMLARRSVSRLYRPPG